jgi:CBS domain-containing protein
MRVSELMQPEVLQAHPEESLADAAARMREHGVGSLAVIDDDGLVGILTERDLLVSVADGCATHVTKVRTYMSSPAVVVAPDADILEARRLMVEHDIRHLPVVAAGQVLGIMSARDLLVGGAWTATIE